MNHPTRQTEKHHPLDSYGAPQRIARIFYWFITLITLGLASGAIILISNYAFPVIIIIANLVMRKRTMVILTLFAIGCVAWLVFGELSRAYTPSTFVSSVPGDFFTVSLIVILTGVMVRFITESLFQTNRNLQQELAERKLAEAKVRQINQELEAKNDELERFTYTVSHDLKAPLVTINGFLGYLEEDATSGNVDRLTKDIQRIQDAATKMQRLLNELLELSRIGRMVNPPETISFIILTQDALDIYMANLKKTASRSNWAQTCPPFMEIGNV